MRSPVVRPENTEDPALSALDVTAFDDTPTATDISWLTDSGLRYTTALAGLQFDDHGQWDGVLEREILPAPGDRLALVRRPDNGADRNVVEVWWRDGHRLAMCCARRRPCWRPGSTPGCRTAPPCGTRAPDGPGRCGRCRPSAPMTGERDPGLGMLSSRGRHGMPEVNRSTTAAMVEAA